MSGFGQTDPVRKQANVQEPSGSLLVNAAKPIRTGCESDPAYLLGSNKLDIYCTLRELLFVGVQDKQYDVDDLKLEL